MTKPHLIHAHLAKLQTSAFDESFLIFILTFQQDFAEYLHKQILLHSQ